MGSELVSDSSPLLRGEAKSVTPLSMTEQFYEVLPFYLSIGMSYEKFWYGDCSAVKYYRKAYEMKQKRRNQELWLQGAYVYEAILDASPILHAFAKSGTEPLPYSSEPYPLTEKDVKEYKARKEKEQFEKQKAMFAAWAAGVNAKKKKEVETNG